MYIGGMGLEYASYIGGTQEDLGKGIAVDKGNKVYVTGFTKSTAAPFPLIGGPDLTHNGNEDTFVVKIQ
jgi:hypothetical protein